MNIILTKTILNNQVILTDATDYSTVARENFAYLLFLNNKRTTGNQNISIVVRDVTSDTEWTLDINDGYYKAELVLIPLFQYLIQGAADADGGHISVGTVTYYNGNFYKALSQIDNISVDTLTPEVDYNNWEKIYDILTPEQVYNNSIIPVFNEQISYNNLEFVYYNNIITKYLNLSKAITKSCNICSNPEIEDLRCLRDKYESIELAVASSNYVGAQTIIESTENLINSCLSC